MGILGGLLVFLGVLLNIGALICFIMVLIKMFQRDQSTLAIVCIILTFCSGVGPLIALIFGWMKAAEWNIKQLMLYFTLCYAGGVVLLLIGYAIVVAAAVAAGGGGDFQFDMNGGGF